MIRTTSTRVNLLSTVSD
jgi:hypothetical protein